MDILNIAAVIIIGGLFTTIVRWIEFSILARRGTIRDPTNNELKRVRALSECHSDYDDLQTYVIDGGDTLETDLLADPVGLPGRRRLLLGSDFLDREDEFVGAVLTLQSARLQNGVYTWQFFANTIRIQLLCVLLLYLFPSISPFPEPLPAVLFGIGVIVLSLVFDYRSRSLIYQSDQHASSVHGHREIERVLQEYVEQAGIPLSRSRIDKHFELSPSIGDRIEKLNSAYKS